MAPSGFDVEGLVVPAYALFALAIGVLAGLVFRRTVAAMTATLVAFASSRFLVLKFLRPHFLAPLHNTVIATDTARTSGDWVLSDVARRRRRPPHHGRRARTSRCCTRSTRGSTRTRISSPSAGSA